MAYGTWRFNAACTRALQLSLSWAESTQFLVLILISSRFILISSSHLSLGLPKGNTLVFKIPSLSHITCVPTSRSHSRAGRVSSFVWARLPHDAHFNFNWNLTWGIFILWEPGWWPHMPDQYLTWGLQMRDGIKMAQQVVSPHTMRLFIIHTCVQSLSNKLNHAYSDINCMEYFKRSDQLHGLWHPDFQCRIHKGFPIIPILSCIKPIPRIDTHFFKIHSNIFLPPTRRRS